MMTTKETIAVKVFSRATMAGALSLIASWAEAPLPQASSLAPPVAWKSSDGILTKTRNYADRPSPLNAKTAKIIPAVAAPAAAQTLTPPQLARVSNAVNGGVCAGLSRRFAIVGPNEPADLTVRMIITHIGKTDENVALVSAGIGVGGIAASAVTGAPIPSVRLPFGQGGLSIVAQVLDWGTRPAAPLLWARGADSFTTNARVAAEADAHTLAKEFAGDFTKLVARGDDPLGLTPDAPTLQGINEYLGSRAQFPACEQFGRNPGPGDTLGSKIGLPPSWTDSGGR